MFYSSLFVGFIIWQYQKPGGAALSGHNHTDRPIFSYWVNDNWGGNGGVTCCWRIQGDTLKVVWILDVTPEQIAMGLDEERHELRLPNPPREHADDTLHVHFLPGGQVQLAWSHSAASPLAEELRQRYPRKTHDHP